MEPCQLVALMSPGVDFIEEVMYHMQFKTGAEKKVGLRFDIDLLTGSEQRNRSNQ